MKRLFLITVALTFVVFSAFAQSEDGKASSGSVYSQIGVGYPLDLANTGAQSMGLLGVSFNEIYVGAIANPAHWGSTVYGLGSGSVKLNTYNATDATGSVTNTNFTIDQFQLQLPMIRGKFGISASFTPVTESKSRTYEENTYLLDGGIENEVLDYSLENRGSGGVNRGELGFGWQINSNISIGYAASVIFLSMDDEYIASFPESPNRDADFNVETNGVGFGQRFGTFVRLPNILQENDQLGIGATIELPVELDSEQKQTGIVDAGGTYISQELEDSEGSIKMPLKVTGGLSYSPSNLMMIGLEGLYEGWSDYETDFQTSEEALYADRYKVGMGMQYFPYLTGSTKFLSGFKYRVGASYDSGHLSIEGERINTLKFALGLGIRSPRSNSSIDLSFEYGIRGTETSNLAKENIWGVRLTLNLAEVMFFRPKLR